MHLLPLLVQLRRLGLGLLQRRLLLVPPLLRLGDHLLDPLLARVRLAARELHVGLGEEAAEVGAVHEVGVQLLVVVVLVVVEILARVFEALNVPGNVCVVMLFINSIN